jgi:hypothetical protein
MATVDGNILANGVGAPTVTVFFIVQVTLLYLDALAALLRINVIHHAMYFRYRYPRYSHLTHRLGAGLLDAAVGRALRRRPTA